MHVLSLSGKDWRESFQTGARDPYRSAMCIARCGQHLFRDTADPRPWGMQGSAGNAKQHCAKSSDFYAGPSRGASVILVDKAMDGAGMIVFDTMVVFALIVALLSTVRVAAEYQRAVVFRIGKYHRTAGPGLYFTIPFLEWRVITDLRILTTAVEQQETITRDNVPVKINAVIWRRTVNPRNAVIEVANVGDSVIQVAVTALRNVIGQHSLDEVLKSQEAIGEALQAHIDAVTEPWGVKVERVQMKNVEIPDSMQRALAQEAEALREKRARQIKAEAEMEAAILLRQAAETIMQAPAALELRRMQMIQEVGAEQNTMTIIMMPSEFIEMARSFSTKSARD
jgi:regulator of protease activity HflC (stomatin/prohibitin superfamily)